MQNDKDHKTMFGFFTYILCTIRKVIHTWFLILNKTDTNQWNKKHNSSSATTLPAFFIQRQNKAPSCLGSHPASDLDCYFFLYHTASISSGLFTVLKLSFSAPSILAPTILLFPLLTLTWIWGKEPSIYDKSLFCQESQRSFIQYIDQYKDKLLLHSIFPTYWMSGYVFTFMFNSSQDFKAFPPPNCFTVLIQFYG